MCEFYNNVIEDDVISVEFLGEQEMEMYDIGMEDTPHTFFANGILVHNSLYIAHYDLLTKNNISTNDDEKCTQFCIDNITSISNELNQFYVVAMRRMFGCQTNRIRILPDVIASTAIWIRKKRYAMRKVYNMETHKAKVAYEYKGLDIVRSSFPKKFRAFLSDVVNSMLDNKSKEVINVSKLLILFSLKKYLNKRLFDSIKKSSLFWELPFKIILMVFSAGVSIVTIFI
jgi:hypothetical protein